MFIHGGLDKKLGTVGAKRAPTILIMIEGNLLMQVEKTPEPLPHYTQHHRCPFENLGRSLGLCFGMGWRLRCIIMLGRFKHSSAYALCCK